MVLSLNDVRVCADQVFLLYVEKILNLIFFHTDMVTFIFLPKQKDNLGIFYYSFDKSLPSKQYFQSDLMRLPYLRRYF